MMILILFFVYFRKSYIYCNYILFDLLLNNDLLNSTTCNIIMNVISEFHSSFYIIILVSMASKVALSRAILVHFELKVD